MTFKRGLPTILLILLFCLTGSRVVADDPERPAPPRVETREGGGTTLGLGLLSFYRDYISAVDGDRCPSHPSCSEFGYLAIKKHGLVIGWMMTVDRLIHEGKDEHATSPLVLSDGKWKIYDPVENNDFWWTPGGEDSGE